MPILEIIKSIANNHDATIGICLGDLEDHNKKVYEASLQFLKKYQSTIVLFGNEKAIQDIKGSSVYDIQNKRIEFNKSNKPEEIIFNSLIKSQIHAIVRGNMSSSKFLANLKKNFNISEIFRLALMETYDGFQFFYGPVGIDECKNIESKVSFVNKAIEELEALNIIPKISILSGGRLGDLGRDSRVDKSINNAKEVVALLKKEHPNLEINHDEILIENAIYNKSNVIIAPDGISGNLIYRTLVHLGGGKAYGAIYMDLDRVIIDTSRVGKPTEIYGALVLASALGH